MYENKPPRHCDKRSKARGSINHPCQKLSVSRLKALNPKSKDQSEKIEIFMLRCKIAQLPKISLKIRGSGTSARLCVGGGVGVSPGFGVVGGDLGSQDFNDRISIPCDPCDPCPLRDLWICDRCGTDVAQMWHRCGRCSRFEEFEIIFTLHDSPENVKRISHNCDSVEASEDAHFHSIFFCSS